MSFGKHTLACGIFLSGLAAFFSLPLNAQNSIQAAEPVVQADAAPAVQSSANEGLTRWLDLRTLSFSLRYKNTIDEYGSHLFEFGQQRSLIDGALKLDSESKYTVNFHVSSGRYFNWAYADVIGGSLNETGAASIQRFPLAGQIAIGTAAVTDPNVPLITQRLLQSAGWSMAVRQLYFSASPIKQLTVEYGSLAIEHGDNSEITTYDDDGFMTGGRVRVKDPNHLFFDQIAVTYGYLGDIYFPSVFDRGDTFGKSNYHQFLAEKKFGSRLGATVDFTEHAGTHTMREAVIGDIHESRALNNVRLELYQRTNEVSLSGLPIPSGSGFALSGNKRFARKWNVDGGYASIDQNYSVYSGSRLLVAAGHAINGDAYSVGNRLFTKVTYKPTPYLTVFAFGTHVVNTDFMTLSRAGYYGGFDLSLKDLINTRYHIF